MLSIGSKAPAFSVYNTDKEIVNNENINGKLTLLLFFPAAFTSTCTRELCAMRDDIVRYNNLKVNILGISTDSVYTLIKYKEDQQLNFNLASDYNKEMSAAFETLYAEFRFGMKGVSKRSAFIIDEEGIIRYMEVLENASEIPDFNAINLMLEKLADKA